MSDVRQAEIRALATVAAEGPRPYTNFQWYLTGARNTVYFTAFTPTLLTRSSFRWMVEDVIGLAPQLNLRNDDRRQAHIDARPFDLEEIISFTELDSFAGFPDSVLSPNQDLFLDPRLPSFRAACFSLRNGANADGNRSFVLYRASHALMEGIDTAQVLRGRPSKHETHPARQVARPLGRLATAIVATLAMPTNFAITAFHWRNNNDCSLRTIALSRRDLKRVATELGVQQRTVIFALVMNGFYHANKRRSLRPRFIGYSNLSPRRFDGDDDFVRLRMQVTTMRQRSSFAEYAEALDLKLAGAGRESLGLQMHYNAIFGFHRRLAKITPALYGKRFFGFAPYDFLLSLVPPHTPSGVFAGLALNDIYCGTHMAGVNCCVIVPQPDRISLNIYSPTRFVDRISDIESLLAAVGIAVVTPAGADSAAISPRSPAEA